MRNGPNPTPSPPDPGAESRSRALAAGLMTVAVGVWAFHAFHAVLSAEPGVDPLVADWLYGALFGAAALSCLLRARREQLRGGDPRPWAIAVVGVVIWGGAEASYRILESDPGAPYPLLTQALLVISFGLATTTLALLGRERIDGFHKGLALDGLIGGLAIASVAAAFLFPVSSTGSIAQPGPPAVFLLADLAILALVVVSTALTGWRPGRCWGLLCAGIVVNTAGNAALVQATNEGSFQRGSVVDTLYVASALLLGIAALYPIRPTVIRRAEDARRVAAPLVFAALALVVLCTAAFVEVGPAAVVLAASTLCLVVLRTAVAFRDNKILLEARQRDALSDGLTTLGNRRRLMGDLEGALAETASGRPHSLILFDLDGFKHYNDAFGHPAGDALLTRLGMSLRDSVAAHGEAYRMGGDEFCAIVRTDGLKADAIVAGACEALSESGSGFSVRPSFGVVALGYEATDAPAALQLADQRMYVDKHGRSGPVNDEARAVLLSILTEREPELDQHLHAVARMARRVAVEMALDNEQIDVVVRAAELHDIGKMAIPDAILYKPGPLSDQEWEIMRRHTIVGERILNSVPALRPVASVVRSTHERIDGEGYPDGLRGDRIPPAARIVTVCDAYNAITSGRAYEAVRSHEEAIAELRDCAGTQFDPEVVEALTRVSRARDSGGPDGLRPETPGQAPARIRDSN